MDKRTTGLIATIASVFLCGCPGIVLCSFGTVIALGGGPLSADNTYDPIGRTGAVGMLCLSLIFIAIPIVVGVLTLRRGRDITTPVVTPASEPVPPTLPGDDEPLPSTPPEDEEPLPPAS